MAVCWFAGLTTLDVVHRAPAPPTRNGKVTATRQDVAAGGPAANAAVTAAALGVRAILVTALGQGPVAAAARADLEAHGVEILDTAAPDFPLAVSAVLVDERTGERSVVSADGALATAPPPATESLHALPHPDAVLLDGHHPQIARAVLTFVQAANPRPHLLLDAGRWRPIFAELLPHADIAALSDDFRVPDAPDTGAGVSDTAAAVLATGASAVVVTHGPAPVEWHTADGGSGTVPVPATDARDTLGAGDAFHGALTAAVATGEALPGAIIRASAVASTRVAVVGPRAWLTRLGPTRLVVE
ncbi:PfkB domain protein [Xylanimonas cellulosilytica DSM 15894]|uniref:PfkB domain protein n=1 Tax=Xylanimonas cellulosilytica (strain DSM 15894 / JCM 12276 / CECT 5975 / KCTC 9989 / LMG 20990 / NBRC 107835 / XIL07) TaxID=446471 RepID=D1BVE6_XYLCX|nr:PfkB family carbohydrate kinase [Xylanimonas cellulosilytica]ACZ29417.1 PfkB domain protein [Xylanimonas cellulosilytica DSM 15894]